MSESTFDQFLSAAADLADARVQIEKPDRTFTGRVGDYPRDWIMGLLNEDDHDAVSIVECLEDSGFTAAEAFDLQQAFCQRAAQ